MGMCLILTFQPEGRFVRVTLASESNEDEDERKVGWMVVGRVGRKVSKVESGVKPSRVGKER
jgi:hypothetical protein